MIKLTPIVLILYIISVIYSNNQQEKRQILEDKYIKDCIDMSRVQSKITRNKCILKYEKYKRRLEND